MRNEIRHHLIAAVAGALIVSMAPAAPPLTRAPRPAEVAARAETAMADGRYAEAADLWAELATQLEAAPEAIFNEAVAAYRAGQLDRARDRFDRAYGRRHDPALTARSAYNLGTAALQNALHPPEIVEPPADDDAPVPDGPTSREAQDAIVEAALLDAMQWYQDALEADPAHDAARDAGRFAHERLAALEASRYGGCCFPDGTCQFVKEPACDTTAGVWLGRETTCDDCASIPSGACCFADQTCDEMWQTTCGTAGGLWIGAGTTCDQCAMLPPGICCLPDGTCEESVTYHDCAGRGGRWLGPEASCESCTQDQGQNQNENQNENQDPHNQQNQSDPSDQQSESDDEPSDAPDQSSQPEQPEGQPERERSPEDQPSSDPAPDQPDDAESDEPQNAESPPESSDGTTRRTLTPAQVKEALQAIRDKERRRREQLARRERRQHQTSEKDW